MATRNTDHRTLKGHSFTEKCSVHGCERGAYSAGLCNKHRQRKRKYGDPTKGGVPRGSDSAIAKFFDYARTFSGNECLIWPFTRTRGYGNFKGKYAHRLLCEEIHGAPASPKMEAAHSCGNGKNGCVNPRHVRWATRLENEQDKLIHGTVARGSRNGHAKISESDVIEIRRLALTHTQAAVANKFNVSQSSVAHMLRGDTWKHVK